MRLAHCNFIFKVTAEQKIIYQSSFPKRVPTSKKDTCVYREANYASLQVGIPGSCKYGYSVVNDPEEVNIASELLDKQVTKVQPGGRDNATEEGILARGRGDFATGPELAPKPTKGLKIS